MAKDVKDIGASDDEREVSKRERLAELQAAGFLQDVELGDL